MRTKLAHHYHYCDACFISWYNENDVQNTAWRQSWRETAAWKDHVDEDEFGVSIQEGEEEPEAFDVSD